MCNVLFERIQKKSSLKLALITKEITLKTYKKGKILKNKGINLQNIFKKKHLLINFVCARYSP